MKFIIASFLLAFTLSSQAETFRPNYIYAERDMADVNWLYAGFAPRARRGDQLNVTISKKGHTLRAELSLDNAALADYPAYLIRRRKELMKSIQQENLNVLQAARLDDYNHAIDEIESEYEQRRGRSARAAYGLELLRQKFPQNIDGDENSVQAHFVYPITTHVDGLVPEPKDYQPYALDERRSEYTLADEGAGEEEGEPWNAHIFGGFPAIWLDPEGHGTGVHGPIRFSQSQDRRRDGHRGHMDKFWEDNNFLNEPFNPIEGLNPSIRWDVVRTNQSKGCFRAETMELRHLMPYRLREVKRVNFKVVDDFDRLPADAEGHALIVNVDYYVESPYEKPDREKWLKDKMVPRGEDVDDWMKANARSFPYLSPMTLEFVTPEGKSAPNIMAHLNQLH